MGRAFRFLTILLFTAHLVIALIPVPGHGEWSNDPAVNTPIATAGGNDWHPRILSDGHGGAIITWDKEGTIYAQRVDANGNVLWLVNGVAVSPDGGCTNPRIADDGNGGAIITWLVDQTGIYAQRLDGNGNLLWGKEGVTISEAGRPFIYSPAIVSDGSGGAIITWIDGRTGNSGLYAQIVNSTGSVRLVANGVAVTGLTPVCQGAIQTVSDGDHGAILSWSDCHNGDANADVYAQRINAGGVLQWGSDGTAVCTADNSQYLSNAESDGNGGAFLTWRDMRASGNSYDIYAQKISAGGVGQWLANGAAVCVLGPAQQTNPVLTADGSGGAFIAWVDYRSVPLSIYAQRLDTNGATQWTSNGIVISDHTFSNEGGLKMADGGNGSAIIGWLDGNNGNGQGFLYAQKIDMSGAGQWTAGGVAVSTPAIWSVFDIGMVKDGSGGAIFTWYDQRNFPVTNNDIYAQKVFPSGVLSPLPPSVTTAVISNITTTTATSGGVVTSDGGDDETARGVCWDISANPTTSGSHTTDGTGAGPFESAITGLSPMTSYHVRAYAVNSAGTAYGEDISFTTNLCAIDVQRGGTNYSTIQEAISGGSGAEIRAVARVFQEEILFSNSSALELYGGYACGFGSTNGVTTVHGTLTLAGNAGVTIGNITLY